MLTPHIVWTPERLSWWKEQQKKGKRRFVLLRGLRIGTIIFLMPSAVIFYLRPNPPQLILLLSIYALIFYAAGFIAAYQHWNKFEMSYNYHQEITKGE